MPADHSPLHRLRQGLRAQRGQALAETLVAGIVLVPMVLLIILLGKYQSIQQAMIAASRTLAFECIVRVDDCADFGAHPELVAEMRARHFARHDAALRTETGGGDAADPATRNPLWVDRRNRSLLERFDDVGGQVSASPFDAGLSVAVGGQAGSVAGAARTLSNIAGPGQFGLDIAGGLFEARAQANLSETLGGSDFLGQLDSLRLRPQARAAILVDAWNASGPYEGGVHSVESRVERGARINEALETAIDIAYLPMRGFIELMTLGMLEENGGRFRYHETDVDLVPADRVGP